jgi:hypothetical protein
MGNFLRPAQFFLHTGFSLVFVAAVKQQHNGRKGGKVKSLGPAGDGNGLVPGSKDDAAGGFLVDAGQLAQGSDEFGNLTPAQILHQGVLVQLAQAHAAAHGAFDPVQIILVLVRRAGHAALGLRQHLIDHGLIYMGLGQDVLFQFGADPPEHIVHQIRRQVPAVQAVCSLMVAPWVSSPAISDF